jgi:sugar (pentulose or hexulose) kinase
MPLGAEDLLFLPYLSGERTPHLDSWARGTFVGLTARHAIPHRPAPLWRAWSFLWGIRWRSCANSTRL